MTSLSVTAGQADGPTWLLGVCEPRFTVSAAVLLPFYYKHFVRARAAPLSHECVALLAALWSGNDPGCFGAFMQCLNDAAASPTLQPIRSMLMNIIRARVLDSLQRPAGFCPSSLLHLCPAAGLALLTLAQLWLN